MPRTLVSALIATTLAAAPLGAQATDWSAAFGLDVVSGRYGGGSGKSVSFNRRLGALPRLGDVEAAFGWFEGSGDYSMFRCHIARQEYCLGGSERLTGASAGLQLTDARMARVLGVDIIPVASVGLDRTRSRITEYEGPIGICIADGQLVSCPDNPPFTEFRDVERSTLPFYSLGIDLQRRVGRVTLRTGIAAYHATWLANEGHARARFSLGLGL